MKKWICTICNYVHEGDEPPDECPICGADKSAFIELKEEAAEAKDSVNQPESTSPSSLRRWKCTICNYIHEGDEPPDECPVCGADSSAFVEIDSDDREIETTTEEAAPAQPQQQTPEAEPAQVEQPQAAPFGFLGSMVMKLHLHAISVHTPNGVIPVAVVFLLLGVFFSFASLEFASFFNLIFVLLSMPVVALTGIISWQVKYRGAKTWVFKTKLACSVIVAVLLTIMVLWRFIDNAIAMSGSVSSWIYMGLGFIILAAAGIAGHLGGTLVHGK